MFNYLAGWVLLDAHQTAMPVSLSPHFTSSRASDWVFCLPCVQGRKSPASTLTLKDCISSALDHHDLISSKILKENLRGEGTLWRISLIIKAEESQGLSSLQATPSLWAPGEWWGSNEDHLCTEWTWDAESPSPSSSDPLVECDNKTLTVYALLVRHLLFTGKAILTWLFLPFFFFFECWWRVILKKEESTFICEWMDKLSPTHTHTQSQLRSGNLILSFIYKAHNKLWAN